MLSHCDLQSDDQGLVNTDPRTIAVPDAFINNIPTDIRGLTFSRTPQQVINIYTLGNPSGISPFFPNGFVGAINRPDGYANQATGLENFPTNPRVAFQVRVTLCVRRAINQSTNQSSNQPNNQSTRLRDRLSRLSRPS